MSGTTNKYLDLWPIAKVAQARAEGWELALVVDSGNPITRSFFDVFDVKEDATFNSRMAAQMFVAMKAKGGSKLHQDALVAMRATSIFRKRS